MLNEVIQWQHEGEAPPIDYCALVGSPKGKATGVGQPFPARSSTAARDDSDHVAGCQMGELMLL